MSGPARAPRRGRYSSGWLYAALVVVARAIHKAAHWVGLEVVAGIRDQQVGELLSVSVGIEPEVVSAGGQDHWHPVVDPVEHGVGPGGQNSARAERPAALVPALPEPGEGEGTAFLHVEVVGLFAPVLALPLVESVGRDQAPPPAEGAAERGLLGSRLAAGVDHARPDLGIVGPRRDEPPPEHLEPPLPFLLQNRSNLLRRGNVVARRKVDRTSIYLELLGQSAGRGGKRIPAAHISHLSKSP